MSVERSFEAWEEVQRHGQDLADRLTQGFTGLIQSHMSPPSFPWPNQHNSKLFDLEFATQKFVRKDFGLAVNSSGINGVSAILDIGNRIGQAGADIGSGFSVVIQQFFRVFPIPFRHEVNASSAACTLRPDMNLDSHRSDGYVKIEDDLSLGLMTKRLRDFGFVENDAGCDSMGDEEEIASFNLRTAANLARPQGIINMTSTYDSRTHDVESSLAARGDLWRIEASHGSSRSGNDNSSPLLVQLGPVLFVRDSTLLLPVHLSKQHLLWYGYDKKNGLHSLCPAVWSKSRQWLLMSMLCFNPLACSFVDLQFPNGKFTYVSGEGLTISSFLPLCGGLLQAQGQYPGEMRFSFSCKNNWGTSITPTVQWPDKSFSLGLAQDMAWHRSGLMVKPAIQLSACPTFGGSNPGLRAEIIHSVREGLSLIGGCALTPHPYTFASISIGRSKWNGNVGNAGIVLRVDTPLLSVGRPSFTVQINSGIEL